MGVLVFAEVQNEERKERYNGICVFYSFLERRDIKQAEARHMIITEAESVCILKQTEAGVGRWESIHIRIDCCRRYRGWRGR